MNERVALVTGGGRGIGREAAQLLASAGARVMVVSRSATELAALGLEYVVADLGTAEGCAVTVAETERRLGPIEMLVVNHGIGSAHERVVWEQDPEVWRETMPATGVRASSRGDGRRHVHAWLRSVVFTSSTAAEGRRSGSAIPLPRMVIGLARGCSGAGRSASHQTPATGWVRRQCRALVKTEAGTACVSASSVARARRHYRRTVFWAREVAHVIAFLCSRRCRGVNGADHGWSRRHLVGDGSSASSRCALRPI